MRQLQRKSSWKREAALAGLLGLLVFWVTASAHIHTTPPSDGVRQECKLCVAGGVSPILAAGALVLTVPLFVFFRFVLSAAQLCPIRCQRACPPRSPPILS